MSKTNPTSSSAKKKAENTAADMSSNLETPTRDGAALQRKESIDIAIEVDSQNPVIDFLNKQKKKINKKLVEIESYEKKQREIEGFIPNSDQMAKISMKEALKGQVTGIETWIPELEKIAASEKEKVATTNAVSGNAAAPPATSTTASQSSQSEATALVAASTNTARTGGDGDVEPAAAMVDEEVRKRVNDQIERVVKALLVNDALRAENKSGIEVNALNFFVHNILNVNATPLSLAFSAKLQSSVSELMKYLDRSEDYIVGNMSYTSIEAFVNDFVLRRDGSDVAPSIATTSTTNKIVTNVVDLASNNAEKTAFSPDTTATNNGDVSGAKQRVREENFDKRRRRGRRYPISDKIDLDTTENSTSPRLPLRNEPVKKREAGGGERERKNVPGPRPSRKDDKGPVDGPRTASVGGPGIAGVSSRRNIGSPLNLKGFAPVASTTTTGDKLYVSGDTNNNNNNNNNNRRRNGNRRDTNNYNDNKTTTSSTATTANKYDNNRNSNINNSNNNRNSSNNNSNRPRRAPQSQTQSASSTATSSKVDAKPPIASQPTGTSDPSKKQNDKI